MSKPYFNPLSAIGRPISFPIASGITFETGMGMYLDNAGAVTNDATGGLFPIGLVDDTQSYTEYDTAVGETVEVAPASGTVVFNLAHPYVDLTTYGVTTGTDMGIQAGADVAYIEQYNTTTGLWVATATTGTIVISSATNGTVTATDVRLNQATGNLRLTITYRWKTNGAATSNTSLGYQKNLDQFGDNSTLASQKATIFFEPGIYETTAYDPYVVYTPGSAVYVRDNGYLSTTKGLTGTCEAVVAGIVIAAPSAIYSDAETLGVSGHNRPRPDSLRVLWNPDKENS